MCNLFAGCPSPWSSPGGRGKSEGLSLVDGWLAGQCSRGFFKNSVLWLTNPLTLVLSRWERESACLWFLIGGGHRPPLQQPLLRGQAHFGDVQLLQRVQHLR